MPRSRGSEMPQRQSPRIPLQLRTSSCESDGHHPPCRLSADRNTKLADRRSTRTPVTEKKRGTRVADMETQLRQAQEELKKLKDQLVASEAAKREAEEELQKCKLEKCSAVGDSNPLEIKETQDEKSVDSSPLLEEIATAEENLAEESFPETDVFEVPLAPMPEPGRVESQGTDMGNDGKTGEECAVLEKEEQLAVPESNEVIELKAQLTAKQEEQERLTAENKKLTKQAAEAAETAVNAQKQQEEAEARMSRASAELEEVKGRLSQSEESLRAEMAAKAGLEAEMKRMRVQTEQWRKAADAAAAVLAGDGRVMGERCGSMDKHLFGMHVENGEGYPPVYGSPMLDEDGLVRGEKRKGSGMRVFGDLWKKKGQK